MSVRPIVALLLLLACVRPAAAGAVEIDPLIACDRAANDAEARWHLPAGLLAAIGTVESGRGGLATAGRVAWPWSINAGGRGIYAPGAAAAVAAVRSFQRAGVQAIDVGCFQVDLYYHPEAFRALDEAFDPATNAAAAAAILANARLSSGSWESAIALYHSATPMRGGPYMRQVLSVWPWARARSLATADTGADAYATFLDPAARLIRVISPSEPPAEAKDIPRVLQGGGAVLQWVGASQPLPVILAPEPSARSRSRSRPAN